jgi:Flp pilus assembly protein TadD
MPARSNRNFLSASYPRSVCKPFLVLAFVVLTPAWSASKWVRIESTHFEVLTDAGEHTGRRVLDRFEQARRVFTNVFTSFNGDFPCRVILFASERDYNRVRPGPAVTGFYQSGSDRDFITMLDGAPELYRVVFHEYTHLVLNHSAAKLPPWLEEGLAEFFSSMAPEDGKVTVGYPVRAHLQSLGSGRWLTASELSAVTKDSPEYNEQSKVGLFYAESWAFTHMLALAPEYRGKLPRMLDRIAASEPPVAAFEQTFRATMDQALARLRAHLNGNWTLIQIPMPPPEAAAAPVVSAIRQDQALTAEAELLMVMGRTDDAANLFNELARKFPKSLAAEAGLATLALRAQRYEEARARFERAIQLGASDGPAYFEYAMLLRDTKAPTERVDEFLTKAVKASPGLAEAHFILGVRASDRGDYSGAVEHLRRAAAILPRQTYFWHALAYAYYKLGQTDHSRAAALRAVNAASSPQELTMARAALNLTAAASHPAESRPSVVTPPSWNNRQGDRRVEGSLVALDCTSTPVRLRIRSGEHLLDLRIMDPRSVVLKGGPASMQLECGPNHNRPVAVEYMANSSEVTAIEFR